MNNLENIYQEKNEKLKDLSQQEEELLYKVQSLKPESLDPDIAEERIRYVLHKGKKTEEVIFA